MQAFKELPPGLRMAIGEAIAAAQLAETCVAQHMVAQSTATPIAVYPLQHHDGYLIPEWEQYLVHAFVELHFDPKTQSRAGAAANARAASLLGMDHNELIERLKKYDVPLPLGLLDAIALFLHALDAARDAVTTCYCRLTPLAGRTSSDTLQPGDSQGSRPPPPAVLVCSTTVKDFDAFGRVHKVAHNTAARPPLQNRDYHYIVTVVVLPSCCSHRWQPSYQMIYLNLVYPIFGRCAPIMHGMAIGGNPRTRLGSEQCMPGCLQPRLITHQ